MVKEVITAYAVTNRIIVIMISPQNSSDIFLAFTMVFHSIQFLHYKLLNRVSCSCHSIWLN